MTNISLRNSRGSVPGSFLYLMILFFEAFQEASNFFEFFEKFSGKNFGNMQLKVRNTIQEGRFGCEVRIG